MSEFDEMINELKPIFNKYGWIYCGVTDGYIKPPTRISLMIAPNDAAELSEPLPQDSIMLRSIPPPDLSIHVTEGIGAKDKMGG